jgi:hypothetical protein
VPSRFNPPPNWPPPPAGWTPPAGWQPDPAWPAPPPGWQLWVEETPAQAPARAPAQAPAQAPAPAANRPPASIADARWTVGGAIAIVIGSLLPWISASNNGLVTVTITGGAKTASLLFGLVLGGIGFVIQAKSARGAFVKPRAYGWGIPLMVLSILGILGYGIFTIAGLSGVNETDALGDTAKVTFTPNVGLVLLFLGCVAVFVGSIKVLRHATRRPLNEPGSYNWASPS